VCPDSINGWPDRHAGALACVPDRRLFTAYRNARHFARFCRVSGTALNRRQTLARTIEESLDRMHGLLIDLNPEVFGTPVTLSWEKITVYQKVNRW